MQKRIKFLFISFVNPFSVTDNKIVLMKNGKEKRLFFYNFKVKFYGSHNKIIFYEKVPKMKNVEFHMGDNSTISIKETPYRIKNLYIDARSDSLKVNIGKDFSLESGIIDFHGEPNLNVNIGDDCQFGSNIEFDVADGHTIYDENNLPINIPQDINIGNHVWLCRNVAILKGVSIPDNCVVAKNSVVTKSFTEMNRVIAGLPAAIKNKYINWSRTPNKSFGKI